MTQPLRIATLVLAAGLSTRFGEHKLLYKLASGRTIIEQSLTSLAYRTRSDIFIVTGYQSGDLSRLLHDYQCLEIHDYAAGMGHSISEGMQQLEELSSGYAAVLITLADQVGIPAVAMERFIAAYENRANSSTVQSACYDLGNQVVRTPPVIFPRRDFDALRSLKGDSGGATVVNQAAKDGRLIIESLPEAEFDIDKIEDLQRLPAALRI